MEKIEDTCTYINNFAVNNHCNIMKKELIHYDRAKALEESKRLLDLLSPHQSHRHHNQIGNISLSSCYHCKTLMPGNLNNNCKLCSEFFCNRHKAEINHNCEKLSKDTAKYLNAKNQFKLKLREAKSKAVR